MKLKIRTKELIKVLCITLVLALFVGSICALGISFYELKKEYTNSLAEQVVYAKQCTEDRYACKDGLKLAIATILQQQEELEMCNNQLKRKQSI